MNEPNLSRRSIFRVLDANANRAGEGLRTLEDASRFLLDDAELQLRLKTLRHDLSSALAKLSRIELLAARDTPGDVGTTATTSAEVHRCDLADVVSAACTRVQQALRCLEEYGKLVDSAFASEVEAIRYLAYDCFARIELRCRCGLSRGERLRDVRLYALIDAGHSQSDLIHRMTELSRCGVEIIQLRDSSVDDRTLFERASAGARAARDLDVLWIVNDRADIAAAAGADGVHVGQEELPVTAVRSIVGPDRLIGLSTHNLDQVRGALNSTADYIGCGPTFPGTTKIFSEYPGCEFLKAVSLELARPESRSLPAFAIGGINLENVERVAEAGFGRIAVTGAFAVDASTDVATRFRGQLARVSLP